MRTLGISWRRVSLRRQASTDSTSSARFQSSRLGGRANSRLSTTGGTGNATLNTSLPVVFGSLPANGQSSTQQLEFNLPATLTAYNIFVTVEVQNANGDTFTNVVSIGHTKP